MAVNIGLITSRHCVPEDAVVACGYFVGNCLHRSGGLIRYGDCGGTYTSAASVKKSATTAAYERKVL